MLTSNETVILLGSSCHPHQEGPGRDDFRTQATEVLPGDASWEIGGPEPEAGGAAGKISHQDHSDKNRLLELETRLREVRVKGDLPRIFVGAPETPASQVSSSNQ